MAQGYVYGGSPASLAARTGTVRPKPPVKPAAKPGARPGAAPSAPLSDSQLASNAIQQIIAPLIAQINQSAATRAQQGSNLIRGYTNDALGKIQAIDFGAPFQQAGQDQNAVNTALLAQLKGSGSDLQNQLAGELGKSVPNMAGAVSGQVGQAVNGAAGANLASGDATLSQLLSQGALAKSYGQKLPGIEQLAGAQDLSKLQGTVNSDANTQLADLQSKVPQMVQDYLGQLTTSRNAQAKLAQDAALAQQKNEVASLIAAGKVKQAEQVAAQNNATRVSIANANNATRANIAAANNATKKAVAQATAGRIDAAASKALGYAVDKSGAPIMRGGKIIPVSKSGATGTPKAPTAAQISKLVDQWKNGTIKSVTSVPKNPDGTPKYTDANGNPKTITQSVEAGQLSFGQAYKRLRAMGVGDKQARSYLDSAYGRGEQGRAWVTNEEQTALKKAGQPAHARVVKGADGKQHGLLTVQQYDALKKAHMLPPGQLTAEGVYVIAGG